MEKGYDLFFNHCYDFDIDLNDTTVNENFDVFSHDFAVVVAKFLCEKNIIEKKLFSINDEEMRKLTYSYDQFDSYYNRRKNAETMKDKSKGAYYISFEKEIMIDKIATNKAYQKIKKPLMSMARSGHDKALAMYLKCELPENWDVDLHQIAKTIVAKRVKTPEEWEVVAALNFHDKLFPNIENMKTLAWQVDNTYKANCEFLMEGKEDGYYQTKKEFCDYVETFMKSPYAYALQKAMFGYYAKYFANKGMPYCTYLDDYLRLKEECKGLCIDKKAFAEYSNGKYYSFDELSKILGKIEIEEYNFDKNKKMNLQDAVEMFLSFLDKYYQDNDARILDRLAIARNLIFYKIEPKGKKQEANKKQGYRILSQISNRKYLNEELNESNEKSSALFNLQKVVEREF